jgi:RNA polymerase sigma-19 factor, ECF subfamily
MSSEHNYLHEEKSLLISLAKSDRRAFDIIYHRYSRELFVKAYHKIGVKEICEDIIQDTFTNLWVKREQLVIRQSLGAYLHGTLDNKIIDYYRQATLRLKHIDQLIELLDQPETSPADRVASREQELTLHGYIAGLSEKMRDIFMLSRYEQLSTDEISQKLSLSNQTVRNQISKALKILRAKMSHERPETNSSEAHQVS